MLVWSLLQNWTHESKSTILLNLAYNTLVCASVQISCGYSVGTSWVYARIYVAGADAARSKVRVALGFCVGVIRVRCARSGGGLVVIWGNVHCACVCVCVWEARGLGL